MADLSFGKILVISFLIVIGLFALSFLLFTSGFKPSYLTEGALAKNSGFALLPGDSLSYEVSYPDGNGTESFLFGKKQLPSANLSKMAFANCTFVLLVGENLTTCIDSDGRDSEGNQSISPRFFFFSPWMLALSPDFKWSAELRNSITGEAMENFSASAQGNETIFGRNAYIVDVNESGALGNTQKKVWVDMKNRIVLKETGENYSSRIIQAPFPLQQ